MPAHCVAYNCNNVANSKAGISAHVFPKDPELRKRWTVATKRKGFIPSDSSCLCSIHFEESAFEIGGLRRRLKKDAIPTIFNFPSHLMPNPSRKRRIIKKLQYEENGDENVESEINNCGEPDKFPDRTSTLLSPSSSEEKSTNTHALPSKKKSLPPMFSPTKFKLRRKVKILQQRLKRREKKINTLKDMILVLKKKCNAPERLYEILENHFSGFPLSLLIQTLNNNGKSKQGYRYTERMKEFALTLYFYSPKAYGFLRKNGFCLPNPSSLRSWLSKFNCAPGFLNEVFLFLKNNVRTKESLKNVNLTFDCMSIRKQLIYDPKTGKNVGYSDLGLGENIDDKEELATEALVFQVVSLKEYFKCAIAYFVIKSINANVLSQLIKMAILKLKDVGINVHNVTCDGPSTNISALQKLGCKLPSKPYFQVVGISHNVCVMLDACHMLKLARNTLAEKKTITSGNGSQIEFKYIERLNSLQTEEGLKLANKLSHSHVYFSNKKMNVKLAAQLLSNSVANALDFLLISNNPDFVGCEETIKFVRTFDKLFDMLNTRDPYGLGSKEPVTKATLCNFNKTLDEIYEYISALEIEGVNVLKHARKTFVLGFLTCINSMKVLNERLLNEIDFKYVLSYKFSQDHLELLFSCIRARGGRNNNPNVVQFRLALRQLMFRNSVQPSRGSNCLDFDEHRQNSELSFHTPAPVEDSTTDIEDPDPILEHISESTGNSYYKDKILYYIRGFIVRKVDTFMKCDECTKLLHDVTLSNHHYGALTSLVSRGYLVKASSDVLKLVKYLYSLFLVNKDKSNFCSKVYILQACMHFRGSIFLNHALNGEYGAECHEAQLIKFIGNVFFKTVCFAHANQKTLSMNRSKLGMRKKLNKIVLFQNV